MKLTYDKLANAAYIRFVPKAPGSVVDTIPCDIDKVNGSINLDFDKNGKIIGIEVLNATEILSAPFLDSAENNTDSV